MLLNDTNSQQVPIDRWEEPPTKDTYSGSFPCTSMKIWMRNSWFFFHLLAFSLYSLSSAPTTVSFGVTSLKSKKNVLSFSCRRCGTFLAFKVHEIKTKIRCYVMHTLKLYRGGMVDDVSKLIIGPNLYLPWTGWHNSSKVCKIFH